MVWLLLALLLETAALGARADLVLADQGRSRYQIVIPAQSLPAERYAAEELQRYLEQISGVRLPVVTDDQPAKSTEILLGDNARLETVGIEVDRARLRTDGFALRTKGRRLAVVGDKPRGTLYGVYALLEERFGVRWFTPEVGQVPQRSRLTLGALDETQVPPLEYREVFWTEMMRDGDFAARHRLNGANYRLTEKHGGRFAVYHPFVHSFDLLVPPELFAEHPEYFPLIKGKRTGGYVQRCLSNPDVLKLSLAKVQQWLREHPEATIISVSQNDTFNNCQCEACLAIDNAEGTPAGSLLRFVNAIAEAIEKDHPQVRIDTLAYQYTRKPPKTLRPRANVIVRLCSIECCFGHPIASGCSEENRRFREDLRAWQPVAPLLYMWDYTPNFAHYQQPFPNLDSLQANVQFFVQHGVNGLFEQGNYSSGGQGELGPLRAYLLAKLLWDPRTDLARHQREFLAAYYGQAAAKVQAYLDLLQQQSTFAGHHAHIFDPPTKPYLSDAFLRDADRVLAEAEQVAENDAVRFRVQVARLPVHYVKLATPRVQGPARAALLGEFLAVARKAGISNISESQALEDWAKKQQSQ